MLDLPHPNNHTMNAPLHVEVVQKQQSRASKEHIEDLVRAFLSEFVSLTPGVAVPSAALSERPELADHVEHITFCDVEHEEDVAPHDVSLTVHVFRLDERGAERDSLAAGGDGGEGEDAAAEVWALPARDLLGLWESLVFDSALKRDTVRLVECALEFSNRGVDPLVVGWNRVVLLHGPPGTGKTSLCRALAQKLAIRFVERYPRARLIEINAHGLFSKWFAESGKLVARLFDRVHEVVSDRRLLACVLLDEVESLAHARRSALAGLEPSDAIRAVNALLTQLDRLRRHPNVLVLTTSNVTGAIDVAFADRADIKRRVGPPSARAAYEILRSCCHELMERGVVSPRERMFALRVLEGAQFAESASSHSSLRLWEVARAAAAARVSARALRRLPFLARALQAPASSPPTLPVFVAALTAALRDHLNDADEFCDEPAPAPVTPPTPVSTPPATNKLNGHCPELSMTSR